MKYRLLLGALATICGAAWAQAPSSTSSSQTAPDTRFFEMRTYYAAPGKLNDLNARFRDHTLMLFEKHGMQNIGYFVPVENTDNKLIYFLAYPNREAREKSWKEFSADPDWQKAQKASELNGRLVAKAESLFLQPTDYSPAATPSVSASPRTFELRTYTAAPGKLSDLNTRFHDHTLALFQKHGIANIAYWVPADKAKGADDTLIYLIAHKDSATAQASWNAFRSDSDWTAAKTASEVNGPLTVPNGVKSVYMTPADYSPMR